MRFLAIAAAALMAGTAQPASQAIPLCPSTQITEVWEQRDRFGQIVFLFGDSIMRGWALGTFDPPTDDPLWCFRSPGSVLTTLQSENALRDYTFVTVNVPEIIEPSLIESYIQSGVVRDGDVIVLEDAGGHPYTPQTYRERVLGVRRAATVDHAVTVVVLTTPDSIDPVRDPQSAPNRWNVNADGMTHNSALRRGATDPIPDTVGRTVLVDWQCHAGPVREQLLQEHGLDIFHRDGIHPNALGQFQLVGLMLDAIGVTVEKTQAVEQIAASVPGRLAYNAELKSAIWGADAAANWVRRLLTQPRVCN